MKPIDIFNKIKDDYTRVYIVLNNVAPILNYENGYVYINQSPKIRAKVFAEAYLVLLQREKDVLTYPPKTLFSEDISWLIRNLMDGMSPTLLNYSLLNEDENGANEIIGHIAQATKLLTKYNT